MNKKLSLFILLLGVCFQFSNAQVGVGTNYPQGSFHVDPLKNNGATLPSEALAGDDFIVTSEGKVGVGTIAPKAKLDIVSTTQAKELRIVDGKQNDGGFFGSNDAVGNGSWYPKPIVQVVNGAIYGENPSETARGARINIQTDVNPTTQDLVLTEGTWLISAKVITGTRTGFNNTAYNGYLIWLYLKEVDDAGTEIATINTIGHPLEDASGSYRISEPQIYSVIKINPGITRKFRIILRTQLPNVVAQPISIEPYNGGFGAPYFNGIRLDSF